MGKHGKRYKEEEIFKIMRDVEGAPRKEEALRKYGVSTAT